MEIIDFGKAKAKEITNFHSLKAFYTKITKSEAPITIGFIHIEQGGVVGYHLAPVPQLFIVVEGEGWVEGFPFIYIISQSLRLHRLYAYDS